jgi:hypothetical protein
MPHVVQATQHWASEGRVAIIVECPGCSWRTFVGYGFDAAEAEASAHVAHDEWVTAGSPPTTQGIEQLYSTYGFSTGRRSVG